MAVKGVSYAKDWIFAHQNYPHEDWCLIWPFFRDKNGRGVLGIDGARYAHSMMCELVNGPAPTPDHGSAHNCGNGHLGCINPKHLAWKTQAENLKDCAAHGTQPKTYLGNRGHFSQEEVAEIRRLLRTHTQLAIAHRYAVTESTISDIARGRYYSRPSKINHWTPEEEARLREALAQGMNFTEASKYVGRSKSATSGHAYRLGLSSGQQAHPRSRKNRLSATTTVQ